MKKGNKQHLVFGWREWVNLPELGVSPIKVKVDTGARTSSLHAFNLRPYVENNIQRIEFSVHPVQRNKEIEIVCSADVVDRRVVSDSGGHKEKRWVIQTLLAVGSDCWPIEVTLTARDSMRFRMLLGRTALKNKVLVNPSASYLQGRQVPSPDQG